MKKITKTRLANGTLIVGGVIIGLSLIWTDPNGNSYWRGKAIGGAIAVLLVLTLCFSVVGITVYRKNRSISKTMKVMREALLAMLSFQPQWKKKRKNK